MLTQCRLCLEFKNLCDSHIVPEYVYKPLYDDRHRLINIYGKNEALDSKLIQKGLREKLLCQECEQFLNRCYEQPCKDMWHSLVFKKSINKIRVTELNDSKGNSCLRFSNFDYQKFKLFLLSIIWRSSVATHHGFNQIDLGPHQETIRKMLWHNNPGKQAEYPCMIYLIKDSPFTPITVSPINPRTEGHRVFRLLLVNVLLCFIVSSHSKRASLAGLSIKEDGTLYTALLRPEDVKILTETLNITKQARIIEQMTKK